MAIATDTGASGRVNAMLHCAARSVAFAVGGSCPNAEPKLDAPEIGGSGTTASTFGGRIT